MILMCKNAKVYNSDTKKVYNENLLPGYMMKNPNNDTLKSWLKLRNSSNTNSVARQLKSLTFGQANRSEINKTTYALSLSDCYWLKDEDDEALFEDISPYYIDFWNGVGEYKSGAVPTLYVVGYLSKEWVNAKELYKYGNETLMEESCSSLCKLCGIPVADVKVLVDGNVSGVVVSNITNSNYMLEQADQSGIINPDDFTELDIIKHFGLSGVQMIVIDAIVGNADRHAGNFGWLRDTTTGEYVGMSPLYDFDHALDSTRNEDRMTRDVVETINSFGNKEYVQEAIRICKVVMGTNFTIVFNKRAMSILHGLES